MSDPVPEAHVIAGQYRLDALLGRGGMGEVHRATDLQSGQVVAVKLIRLAADDAEATRRFIREASQTAALDHPNIVRALDFGEAPGSLLYLVIEYLEGESLRHVLKREGRLSPARAVHIATQLCAALGAVHDAGIVHRDVKPANVMRVLVGDQETMKLIDFGIARGGADSTRLTGTGLMVGTLEYCSPEQVSGNPLDGRSDQYSLGVMLYEMLSGLPLFEGISGTALMFHHLEVMPVRLRARVPAAGISPALDEVVRRCLSKVPSQRFPSMAALSAALVHALESPAEVAQPAPSALVVVDAPPPSWSVRKLLVPLGLLLVGLGALGWQGLKPRYPTLLPFLDSRQQQHSFAEYRSFRRPVIVALVSAHDSMSERSIGALQKLRAEFSESRLGLVAFNMDSAELHFRLPPDDQLGFSFVETRDNPGLALDLRMTLGTHYGGDLVLISSGGGIKETIRAMDLDAASFETQVRALAAGAVR